MMKPLTLTLTLILIGTEKALTMMRPHRITSLLRYQVSCCWVSLPRYLTLILILTLTLIGGLMLGLPSEMLRYKGMTPMHFRGLAHASTNRWQHTYSAWVASPACPDEFTVSPSCDPFDPRDVWALQSSFGIADSRMVGWWEELDEVDSLRTYVDP